MQPDRIDSFEQLNDLNEEQHFEVALICFSRVLFLHEAIT